MFLLAGPTKEVAPPPVVQAPICDTYEAVTGSLTAGTTVIRELRGAEAEALSRRLSEGQTAADHIIFVTNPQYPSMVWVVGFLNNCVVGEGIISRRDYDILNGAPA